MGIIVESTFFWDICLVLLFFINKGETMESSLKFSCGRRETMESSSKLNHPTPHMLALIPFFKDMEKGSLELLSERMRILNVNKGHLIIAEGDEEKKMYFIIEGTVDIFRMNHKGQTEYIYELKAPSHFGEMSIMDGGPRSASVEAKTNVVLAELNWEDVRTLFEDKPEIMCYIFKYIGSILSMRLRRANSLSWRLSRV